MKKYLFETIIITILTIINVKGFAYEQDVKVINEVAGISLAGTLALPDNNQPKALLVFASGSGAQNRDEEIFGLKPFKVLSDTLVSEGYGTLRLDDRGVGGSEGKFDDVILDDLTGDILAGVTYLRHLYPDTKIGVLGHSQGGQVAVKLASKDNLDFIVTLAAPAWKGDSLIMSQCRAMAIATNGSWPNENLERRLLDIAMSDIPTAIGKTLLYNEMISTIGEVAGITQVQSQIFEQVVPLMSPMYRNLLRYNPENDIKAVNVPWIALNGDKDLQVLVQNLSTIKDFNPQATTIIIEDHNHLFQPAISGLPNEYPTGGQSPSKKTLEILLRELNKIF